MKSLSALASFLAVLAVVITALVSAGPEPGTGGAGEAGGRVSPGLESDGPEAGRPGIGWVVDNSELDRSNRERLNSYADILERATPAVVGVYTARIIDFSEEAGAGRRGRNPLEDFLRRYYGLPEGPSQPEGTPGQPRRREERVPTGVGSGVIVSADGYILTNNHVVTGEEEEVVDEIVVKLPDGREFEAVVVGRDPGTDIAVLKVEAGNALPVVTLTNSDALRVGDIAFAIGNPLEVGLTVTQGIISATGRTDLGILGLGGYENFIQTDASINFGNSGGALVDSEGRLIGINTAIMSRTGGNIGIGFAIPSNLARSIMANLIQSGEVQRGFLGVLPGNLTPELAESFGLDKPEGAIVNQVTAGMPADRAGIRHGDIILKVNGAPIRSAADLRLRISQTAPGSEVQITLQREGKPMEVTVVLANLQEGIAVVTPESPLEGVVLAALNREMRTAFEVPEEVEGVLVTEVEAGSPYEDVLDSGMVLVEVNRREIRTVEDLEEALSRRVNRVYAWQDGSYGYLALTRE